MGKRGPRSEPTELKEVKGTRKKSRDPDPIATTYGLPECPFDAKGAQREHQAWMGIIRSMVDSGTHIVLTPADFASIEMAAVALARARAATEEASVLEPGVGPERRYVRTKANGIIQHPALREEKTAWAEARRYLADLGMSPTARVDLAKAAMGDDTKGAPNARTDDAVIAQIRAIAPLPMD